MTVLILTPLPLEYAAVAKHLERKQEVLYNGGAAYEVGHFVGKHDTYKIVLCEPGIKNVDMALATEKAIQCFQPHIVLLIGIAGGVKDVKIGDVLIAKKVYGYESGKEDADGFKARPAVESFSRELLARAQVLSRRDDWKKRTDDNAPDAKVFIGPIAAGDKVVAGTNNPTFQWIKSYYNDTLGLEMEAIGFATALQGHRLEGLAIRGISDLCEDKAETNKEKWQLVAAERAAAFAFELLYELDASQFVNSALNDKSPDKHQKNLDFSAASTQLFLKKVEPDLLQETIARSEIPWQEIDQFFENPQKRILFIYGSGETGKTHLLRDLIVSAISKKWHTCAIERPVTESFADSLPKEKPVLLFKDDIDWEKEEFLLPVLQLVDSNPNLRLIWVYFKLSLKRPEQLPIG